MCTLYIIQTQNVGSGGKSAAGIAGLFSRRAGLAPFPWLGNYELRGPGEKIEPRRWKRGNLRHAMFFRPAERSKLAKYSVSQPSKAIGQLNNR